MEFSKSAKETSESFENLVSQSFEPGKIGDKAKSMIATQWLLDNFVLHTSSSVARSLVYEEYEEFCQLHNIHPVHFPWLGRIVRVVFPGIGIRRLGGRGASKYFYTGLRRKDEVFHSLEDPAISNNENHSNATLEPLLDIEGDSVKLKEFHIDPKKFSSSFSEFHVASFVENYHKHCQQILEKCQYFKFNEIEHLLSEFWGGVNQEQTLFLNSDYGQDSLLKFDLHLYDTIVKLLIPSVSKPVPIQFLQAIRSFCKSLEGWVYDALPTELEESSPFIDSKAIAMNVFIPQLKRQASLNYLAQSVSPLFDSNEVIQALMLEWNKCDFVGIRDQANWITDCNPIHALQIMEIDIRKMLANNAKIDKWMRWVESVTSKCIDEILKSNSDSDHVQCCKQFVMSWNFYGSIIVREFTFKSSPGIGSLHLIKMFLDEYVYYCIEKRLSGLEYQQDLNLPCILS